METIKGRPYFIGVLCVIMLAWIWSLWHPVTPLNWVRENIAVLFLVPVFVYLMLYIRFSNFSITLLAVFLILHFIGAHYNYGEVGIGEWLQQIFHSSKNVYDRLVHFSFGFLLYYPVRETFLRIADTKGFWSYYLPLDVILSFSALYEIFEWFVVTGMDSRIAFLFIGGNDPMDATKDMAMAALGASIALAIVATLDAVATKHFTKKIMSGFKINRDRFLAVDSFIHRFFSSK